MTHSLVLAYLLTTYAFVFTSDASPASNEYDPSVDSSSADDQEFDCPADPSMSLLQTQLQVDHVDVQHIALKKEARINNTAYDSFETAVAEAAEVLLTKPYQATCGDFSIHKVGKTIIKHAFPALLALICVVPAVIAASRAQNTAAEHSLSRLQPVDNPVTSVPLSPLITRFLLMSFLLVMINQTIVMPASENKSESVGRGVGFSGLVIGSYGLGVALSLPFFLYCTYRSYRLGLLFVGIVSVIGNITYAMGNSPVVIVLARMLVGLEGGVLFMNSAIVQQLSQGDGLVSAAAQMSMFPFLGLILGPIIASACESLVPQAPHPVPPSVFMATCSLIYTCLVWVYFPSNEQCFTLAHTAGLMTPEELHNHRTLRTVHTPGGGRSSGTVTTPRGDRTPQNTSNRSGSSEKEMPPEGRQQLKEEHDLTYKAELRSSQLSVVLLSAVNLSRMLQRLFWEAATLHLLATNYSLGSAAAGAILTISLLGLLFLPLFVLSLKRMIGLDGGLRVMDLVELLGIFLMCRVPSIGLTYLIWFVIGSSLFSLGNLGQFSFLVPLRAELQIPQVWVLSIEGGVFVYILCQALGIFLGPVAARDIQNLCDAQNTIPAFLLTTWIFNMICKEISVGLLLKQVQSRTAP